MKTPAIAAALALAAVAFAAQAQTGTPSAQEVGAQSPFSHSAPVDVDADAGSYARYLMLNGTPRDEALKAAQNIDHPNARHFAFHRAAKPATAAATSTQQ